MSISLEIHNCSWDELLSPPRVLLRSPRLLLVLCTRINTSADPGNWGSENVADMGNFFFPSAYIAH